MIARARPGATVVELLGVEAREADAAALVRLRSRGKTGAGETDAAERQAEQLEIGRRAGERGGHVGAERAAR